jgi:hypothetical protein
VVVPHRRRAQDVGPSGQTGAAAPASDVAFFRSTTNRTHWSLSVNLTSSTERPSVSRRAGLPAAVVLGLAGASVLVPSVAQAAEGVSSNYNVGCTIHPDQGFDSTDDPGGVSFDGEQNDVTASPLTHTITASSLSTYPGFETSGQTGEDCGVAGSWSDRLTVGAGTSDVPAGSEVPVQVTVHLDADLAEQWGADPFRTRARYSATTSIVSLDDCDWAGEGFDCETPLSFGADHEHYVYWSPDDQWHTGDYVYAQADRDHHFVTNGAGGDPEVADNFVSEDGDVCDPFPCSGAVPNHAPHPETYTATAVLVVGDRYDLEGYLNLFTQAYDSTDARGAVTVDDFSLTVTPLVSGVDLAYASSEGGAADSTPPVISGAEDVTVSSPDGAAVPVSFTVEANDDVDGTVPVTCTPASGTSFAVGTTTVTCEARDTAGNAAVAAFDVTVQAGPTVQLGTALTALSVHQGIRNAPQSKYDTAVAAFAAGRDADGCGALRALTQQVAAQKGKKIGAADAAALTALVADARAEQGC